MQLLEQMSRREQVESQLRQSQKMQALGQLTGGIAHDFNNMLGVIMGAHDLILRRIRKGDFGIERFVEAAANAAERAASLTQRLLAFARQQPLAPQPIDANKMISGMSDLLQSTLGEQIQIETVTAAGLWTINADAQQLESAILNVAINARDAMPDGGKLTIETANALSGRSLLPAESGDRARTVRDDRDHRYRHRHAARRGRARVRSIFHDQAHRQRYRLGPQSSLRLRQTIARAHQGLFRSWRRHDGEDLSAAPHRRREGSQTGAIEPCATGDRSEVILVVEDDPLMRRLTSEALHELGYTVFDSDSAANALAILDREPDVKLLFTDVVMPDINGKKLADEALRRRPGLKVLFTTGYTANAVVHGGVLDAGVNFISKPFTLDQLAAKVRAVLDA